MKISAPDLGKLKLIDGVILEPKGGAHHDHKLSAENLRDAVINQIQSLQKLSEEELLDQRYAKFRAFGEWQGE